MSLDRIDFAVHLSGAFDLQIHVAVRDVGHLRDFIMDTLATETEVDRFETSIIYLSERKMRLSGYIV